MTAFYIIGVALLTFAAYRRGWLSLSGSIAAMLLGSVIAFAFGGAGLLLLGVFFVPSSLLSKLQPASADKEGSKRTAGQVLANGGAAGAAAFGALLFPHPFWLAAAAGGLAAASSDTWASEIGRMKRQIPWHVRERKHVMPGRSGAVSKAGTLGAAYGAAFVAIAGSAVTEGSALQAFIIIFAAGFLGHFIDTLAGAYVEAEYQCKACGRLVDTSVHCNQTTMRVRGFAFCTNEAVNTLCTLSGAGFALLGFWLFDLV
ncbi:uncharacterized protein (TIGR00297 family) [Salsuginibacillus halophilus]|uniref:Uncharacterized protein (TIGR00297 family) n=1 Tax=Salsuginibacillus halophilus TaxID=517424 RepID=A0A2P8H7X5_9BACI|nr:DUF92 domain-containing protein [Salsuginibacillus halophilus]PSL42318.1 uncharacterized protein (TIGR00297 family) [Salsuginibacillus halophilus]